MDTCDICKSDIKDGQCDCGYWFKNKDQPSMIITFERAIEAYNFYCDQNHATGPMSFDHHSGTCMIIFKGDWNKCMYIRDIIEGLE